VVDEPGVVAADVGVAAPGAVDAEHPDAALAKVAILAVHALLVRDQLARVVDDPLVLVDGLEREDPEAVQLRLPAANPRQVQRRGGGLRGGGPAFGRFSHAKVPQV
jgi:hypothetical protein